jgi:hypothetical protein
MSETSPLCVRLSDDVSVVDEASRSSVKKYETHCFSWALVSVFGKLISRSLSKKSDGLCSSYGILVLFKLTCNTTKTVSVYDPIYNG